jgi:hypothetical protein
MIDFMIIIKVVSITLIIFHLTVFAFSQNEVSTCEEVSLKLDGVRNKSTDTKSSEKIIVIARLGKKEKNLSLSEYRLFSIKKYLSNRGISPEDIITVLGEKTKGSGIIEIYIKGAHFETIYAKYNETIPVGYCENSYLDNKRFQLKNLKNKRLINKYGRIF